jgi:hypothetical protein
MKKGKGTSSGHYSCLFREREIVFKELDVLDWSELKNVILNVLPWSKLAKY